MMKKTIIALVVAAFSLAVALAIFMHPSEDNIFYANVDALTDPGEEGTNTYQCYNNIHSDDLQQVFYCGTCDWITGAADFIFPGKGQCTR